MAKIPQQPTIKETAPGHLYVDPGELQQYNKDMMIFEAAFNNAIKDCDPNDPDAIIAAVFGMFKT